MTTTPSPEAVAARDFQGRPLIPVSADAFDIPTPTDSGEVVQGDRDLLIRLLSPDADTTDAIYAGRAFTAEVEMLRDHRLAFSRPEPVGDQAEVLPGQVPAFLNAPTFDDRTEERVCINGCLFLRADYWLRRGLVPQPKAGDMGPAAWLYTTHLGQAFVSTFKRTHYDGYPLTDETPLYARPEPVGDEALVERVAKAIMISRKARKSPGYAHLPADHVNPFPADYEDARAAIQAIPAPATDAGQSADSGIAFPKLTEAMITAACAAHFGKAITDRLGTTGIDLTANGINYTFRDALKRMWPALRRASLPKSPSAGEEA